MSAIHDLIQQVDDLRLRERLAAEWVAASQEKKFGLVFEDHLPELLPLHKARPRRGDLVCRRDAPLTDVWQIRRINDGLATCVKPRTGAGGVKAASETESAAEQINFSVDDLLVVRQFGEPIFPSLMPVDSVQNGPMEAPWHTLIEADNYHALHGGSSFSGYRIRWTFILRTLCKAKSAGGNRSLFSYCRRGRSLQSRRTIPRVPAQHRGSSVRRKLFVGTLNPRFKGAGASGIPGGTCLAICTREGSPSLFRYQHRLHLKRCRSS